MSAAVTFWCVVLLVGAGNYAARLSFIALFARRDMPLLATQALRYVPAAMLTAIVAPVVVFASPGIVDLSWSNPRLVAAIVATAVAWRWRHMTVTIASGMATLWVAKWITQAAG